MTMAANETIRCFMCGSKKKYGVLMSTSSFGPTDLDTRPAEMKRSTMSYWVQTCPVCGYSAVNVSDDTTITREFLKAKRYRTCDGIAFKSDLAKAFYQHYLIQAEEGKDENAFYALLHAAWASDDRKDSTNARRMREKAIDIADRLLENERLEWRDTISLIRADLLRRTSRFKELLEKYEDTKYDEELLNQIIDFQKQLARRRNTECLTVGDAAAYAEGSFALVNE